MASGAAAWAQTSWVAVGSGEFLAGANWSAGAPDSTVDATISNGTVADFSNVELDGAGTVRNLTIGAGYNGLAINLGSSLTVYGTSIVNAGTIDATAGSGNNTALVLANNVTLSGAGVLSLNYGDHNGTVTIASSGASFTLTNQSTIWGDGVIGSGALALANTASGLIEANLSGQTLLLNGGGGIANAGLLEASGGGLLQLSAAVANTGGTITANGGTVLLSATVTGGTLTTAAAGVLETNGTAGLAALTLSTASTYTGPLGSTTNFQGAITNYGTFAFVAGSGNNTVMAIAANTTLQGGGTVTLDSGDTNGLVYVEEEGLGLTLTNVDNQIQGYGDIGHGGLALANAPSGIIDANVAAETLTLDGSGGVSNQGVLEATAGGILQLSTSVNNASGAITASGGTVNVSATVMGGTLASAYGGTLQTIGTATLDGSTAGPLTLAAGTYAGTPNSNTNVLGTIVLDGTLQLNAGSGNNTTLNVTGPTTLQGPGAVTLNSGDNNGHAYIQQAGGAYTLTNELVIQGYGVIGNGGLTLVNAAGATIDANVTGQTLTINPSGGFTNAGGTLEASGGGTLALSSASLDNSGGTIEVSGTGSVVQFVNNAVIEGGTLTTVNGGTLGIPDTTITLDGSTQGPLTLSAGSTYTGAFNTTTYLRGTITNHGTFQLDAGSGNNTALSAAADTTLQGGGSVTLNSGDNNGKVYLEQAAGGLTLTNADNLIQGYGVIGNGGLAFVNAAAGIVNANSPAGLLVLNGGGNVVNAGLLEATNGGTLVIDNVVSNTGAAITANGGTVLVNGTIAGGTLSSLNGGTLGDGAGSATLDSSVNPVTLPLGSTWVAGLGSQTTVLGAMTIGGALQLTAGSGHNTTLLLAANTSLSGGGTVTLNSGDDNGQAYIEQSLGGLTLTDAGVTIQGYGVIGNGGLTLVVGSGAVIDANVAGQTLVINNSGGVTTSGTLEATAAGTLQLATVVTNNGGISASAGTVNLQGATVEGGTLAGAGLQTTSNATLDGATNGPLTLAAGAVYTGLAGTTTHLLGTFDNAGTIQLNAGSGNNTDLDLTASVTLQGGGTLTLNSGDDNGQVYLQQSVGSLTLTNVDNLVEGYGVIGNGGISLLNEAQGVIEAAGAGQTLNLNASGAVTNHGTFAAAAAAVLSLANDPTNLAGNTLTGGTWSAAGGGVVSFESPANAVVTNDASLVLDGAGSEIRTLTGAGGTYQTVEQTLVTNNGTLAVTGGRDFAAANPLANNGVIQLGGGTLTAPALTNGPGSSLTGFGTFAPTGGTAVAGGATVSPGTGATGQQIATLSFGTGLTLGSGGAMTFSLQNAAGVAGTDYSTLSVTGALTLTATAGSPFSIALASVNPATGAAGPASFNAAQAYTWTLASAGSITGFNPAAFAFNTAAFQNSLNGGTLAVAETGNTLTLDFTPVPEPATWVLLLAGTGLAGCGLRRRPGALRSASPHSSSARRHSRRD